MGGRLRVTTKTRFDEWYSSRRATKSGRGKQRKRAVAHKEEAHGEAHSVGGRRPFVPIEDPDRTVAHCAFRRKP